MQQYMKAIMALVTPIVVTLVLNFLKTLGVEVDTSVQNAVTVLVTAGTVWFVPNKQ